MALKAGSNVVFKLTDGGDVERDLSAFVAKVSFNLKGKGLVDVTTMGQSGHKWMSDELEDGSFTVDFFYDPTADTGTWDALTSLRTTTVAKAFEIGPQGSAGSDPKITGNCWMEDLPMDMAVGDVLKMFSVPFKVDGTVSITTY